MPPRSNSRLIDATIGRPNTQLPPRKLTRDVVLCCGEHLPEFLESVSRIFGKPRSIHSYRCYSFFKLRELSFIWTGIGTGCLEPLLCETMSEIDRIILVGTAGAISETARLGGAEIISEAKTAGAGISSNKQVLRPNWPLSASSNLPARKIVSTDYYYGFSLKNQWPTRRLWAADKRLAASVPRLLKWADLVDMETDQFYHLCDTLKPKACYVAIKGASNNLADHSEQPRHSHSVLTSALDIAKRLFQ